MGIAPDRPYPEGAYGRRGTMRGFQDIDEAEAKRRMRKPIDDANNTAHGRLFGGLFNGFTGIGQLLGSIADAFLGRGSFGLGPLKEINDRGQLITGYGQKIQGLENVTRTGVTTPTYASAGGRDIVTFPDTMMQHLYYRDDNPIGYNTYKTYVPAFNQASTISHATADFAFLRGGLDRPTPLEAIRIISGDDNSLFGIDSWNLAIYGYDKPGQRMLKIWDSGDIKAVLTAKRRRYHIATGLNLLAEPDQLFAIASLQFAPGLLQQPRGIGCIFLTGISEEEGTVPQARHATLAGLRSLPDSVPLSSLNYDRNKLMWAAMGATATS